MMFECYKEEVTIKDKKGNEFIYELKPLSGRWLPTLYKVMKGFSGVSEDSTTLDSMDENLMGDLHKLALETMKASYPKENEDELDRWVSQNLTVLLEPLIKVNLGLDMNKKSD